MKWIVEMPDDFKPIDWAGCEHIELAVVLSKAKKARKVASGKVREATMIEEATYIGETDITMAFKEGENISVYEVKED